MHLIKPFKNSAEMCGYNRILIHFLNTWEYSANKWVHLSVSSAFTFKLSTREHKISKDVYISVRSIKTSAQTSLDSFEEWTKEVKYTTSRQDKERMILDIKPDKNERDRRLTYTYKCNRPHFMHAQTQTRTHRSHTLMMSLIWIF